MIFPRPEPLLLWWTGPRKHQIGPKENMRLFEDHLGHDNQYFLFHAAAGQSRSFRLLLYQAWLAKSGPSPNLHGFTCH